jgi:hypothetical protein
MPTERIDSSGLFVMPNRPLRTAKNLSYDCKSSTTSVCHCSKLFILDFADAGIKWAPKSFVVKLPVHGGRGE